MTRRGWLGVGLLAVALLLAAADLGRPLPDRWFAAEGNRIVEDRRGNVLAERPVPERGHETWVDVAAVSPHVVQALVASEDQRFYEHRGVDPRAVGRALRAAWRAGRFTEGGSTLSQQTARLLAGRPRGLRGKVVEAWRALRLEAHLDKDEILAWHLNRAYFGRGAIGIEAAARRVFDESAASLSVAEAALLVGLLPAPERLHPEIDLEAAKGARRHVLGRMVATGRLTAEVAERAAEEPIELRRRSLDRVAPHLVARALDQRRRPVVRTAIDLGLQLDVEALVARQLASLEGLEVDHAAVLVVEVATGDVLAYVGSGGFERAGGHVDAVRAKRSPGSALKPFVYALGLEKGLRPSDVLFDVPVRFGTRHGVWTPENYDRTFRGPIRVREALASSTNVPAVAVLDQVGASTLHERLVIAGFELPETTDHYGLGLALGDAEVTLETLTAAYAALSRGGVWRPLRLFLDDADGDKAVRFVDRGAATLVADILADPAARAPGFGRFGPLERAYWAAVKTGTSTGYRDNWTVGFTPVHAVGVWVGNFDGRPMGDVSGVTGAGPLWAAVMDRVSNLDAPRPPDPPGYERRPTCALSGGAVGPHCPAVVHDWVPIEAQDRPVCAWHAGSSGGGSSPCAVDWPPELVGWARDEGQLAPSGCSDQGEVSIAWPEAGTVVYIDPRMPAEAQRIPLRAAAPAGAVVVFSVDGQAVGEAGAGEPLFWQPTHGGPHRVVVSLDGHERHAVTVEVRGLP